MLPEVFEESKAVLNDALSRGFITMKMYGENAVSNVLKVVDYTITDHAGSHPKAEITYTKTSPLTSDRNEHRTMLLVVFNSTSSLAKGEVGWRPSFKSRLFRGNPPFTIAIDVHRKNIYLVHLNPNGIELNLFTEINEEDTKMILSEASVTTPYSLRVPPEVLMDMISGDEGYNHAYRNLQVVFNCAVPIVFNNGLILD